MSTIEDQAVPVEAEVMGGVSSADGKPRVAVVFVALDLTLFYSPDEARHIAGLLIESADHAEREAVKLNPS